MTTQPFNQYWPGTCPFPVHSNGDHVPDYIIPTQRTMQSYERLSSSFPGSLTFQKVRPARSSGTLVTSIKYSPVSKSGSDGMIAVADINGSLTIHSRLLLEIIQQYDVAMKASSEVNEIRALAWNPRQTSKLYVGFANGNIIVYEFDMGTGEGKDRTSQMSFRGPINDIALNPLGLELAVAYGEDVALIQRPEFGGEYPEFTASKASCHSGTDQIMQLPRNVQLQLYISHTMAPYDGVSSRLLKTLLHAYSGAESYLLPQCQLLVKRNLYAKKNVNKEKFAVDMVFIDEDTVVVGGPLSTLTFTDV
ncbi:hypothetical protein BDN71DRAFT_1427489 [Pleurotus eryngii]|uniref:Uncharacterized protein n=1 Tax=Pleurotus eryngii TaxID=5323 RepID=A0A9P6DJ12_PLEER|nr:hypothetical protein BDN71DRAFT_1427489 [Pleurotus eryngii]